MFQWDSFHYSTVEKKQQACNKNMFITITVLKCNMVMKKIKALNYVSAVTRYDYIPKHFI
jgi:hypothetical protein